LFIDNLIINSLKEYNVEQLRIFYNILYLYKEEVKFKDMEITDELRIHVSQIKDIMAEYRISFNNVMELIENMPSKVMFISKDAKVQGALGIFNYFMYDFDTDEYMISFTDEIKPYLFELERKFCKIDLKELKSLKETYSQRLYELCCCYVNQGIYRMKIDVFRRYMRIPDSYRMCDITERILKKTINKINKNTNKKITFKNEKTKRNITHILFNFKEEKENE